MNKFTKINELIKTLYNYVSGVLIANFIVITAELVRIILNSCGVISNTANLYWAIGSMSIALFLLLFLIVICCTITFRVVVLLKDQVEELTKKIEEKQEDKE